ncbi:MAG: 3-isopropylmalate dehydratase small subunit [Burkholderiales bacterium]
MDKFTVVTGLVVPLDRSNVDTDAIIPKQFLKSIKRSGFGPNLFDAWRYLDVGQPGMDHSKRPVNRDFVLNHPHYKDAEILLARANFGCGSSREHAPWALLDHGFRAVIAPSFGEIFQSNSLKNGLLPVVLTEQEVDALFYDVASFPGMRLTIDLAQQTVATTDGAKVMHFDIDPFRKHCLLNGLDEIGLTLRHEDKIREFEERRRAQHPWLFG